MKIILTFPTIITPHGGARVLFEWCYRLKKLGHDVGLFVENGKLQCTWYDLSGITVTADHSAYKHYDCIVIGSPHSIWLQDHIRPHQKCFLFMQMVEEYFRPGNALWKKQCEQFYLSKYPIIHGSRWGEEHCRNLGRTCEMHYIGNGVNFEHFPIINKPKDGKTILLEGCFNNNPAKDVDRIAYKTAMRLRKEFGFTVKAYGFDLPNIEASMLDEYICRPSLTEMNRLYEEATILLKATKYDARALSPVESMTKGTVTVRSIIMGDDDLIQGYNCLRGNYNNPDQFLQFAKSILEHTPQREKLAKNCIQYVQEQCNWDTIIDKLNKILTA